MLQRPSRRAAAGSLLVVASAVSQAANDKQQLELMLDKIKALPEELGKPENLLADTGYFSANECRGLREGGDRAVDRQGPSAASPAAGRALRSDTGSAGRSNAGRGPWRIGWKTLAGRAFLRAAQADPGACVRGIIKSALGFRQFSLRGLNGARGEWSLVTMAWNIKRLFACVPA